MIENYDGQDSYLPVLNQLISIRPFYSCIAISATQMATKMLMEHCSTVVSIETQSLDNYNEIGKINPNCLYMPDMADLMLFLDDSSMIYNVSIVDNVGGAGFFVVQKLMSKLNFLILVHDTEKSENAYDKCTMLNGYRYIDFVQHRPWTGVFTCETYMANELICNQPGFLYSNNDDLKTKTYLY
jgi:hypothetical protein